MNLITKKIWEYEEIDKIHAGWAEFLGKYTWEWIFVLEPYKTEYKGIHLAPVTYGNKHYDAGYIGMKNGKKKCFKDAGAYLEFIKTGFIRKLYRDGKQLSHAIFIEPNPIGIGYHAHGLLSGINYMTYNEVRKIWRNLNGYYNHDKGSWEPDGIAYFEKYDPVRGWIRYSTKYITRDICDYDVNLKREHKIDYQS